VTPPKKTEPAEDFPANSEELEGELEELVVGRHGERRISLTILKTLIEILKVLERR
jgi:hypothetical protein